MVPNGVGSQFRPISRETAQGLVRNKFGVDGPYVLMVGDLQPRKNQAGLIHAFDELLRSNAELPHRLVLTGQDSWYASSVRRFAARSAFRNRIHFTGFVDDADLPLGELRLRSGGSSGGHHGLESIERRVGTREFARLRIGIGRADGAREITDHVLGRFSAAEAAVAEKVLTVACDQVECWLHDGIQKAMTQFNGIVESSNG